MFPNWVGVIIVKRTVLESVLRYILVFLNCDDTMIAKHDALVCWFSFVSCVSQFGRCYKRKKGSTVNGLLCSVLQISGCVVVLITVVWSVFVIIMMKNFVSFIGSST